MKGFKYIGIILFILLLGAHTQAQTFVVHEGDTINRTDKNGLKQGVWREFYAGGGLKRETFYKNSLKSGLDLEFYRLPNCMKAETNYKNDSLDGPRILYHRNCNIAFIDAFSRGRADGFSRKYRWNGSLESEGLYKNGELVGFIKEYDEKGKIKSENGSRGSRANLENYITGESKIQDSAIMKGMARLNLTSKTIVVADVTGSMYGYIGQLLLWYKLNMDTSPVRQFVFFNDGDDKPDRLKKIGSTGGIYFCKPDKLIQLKNSMEKAINGGSGGDYPENDIEGILKGIGHFKKTDQVILIADRTSSVKDITLLRGIHVPVQVILCGGPEFTQQNYLDIAYYTKGSIQTLTEQLTDIHSVREGAIVRVASLRFQFKNGSFRRINLSDGL